MEFEGADNGYGFFVLRYGEHRVCGINYTVSTNCLNYARHDLAGLRFITPCVWLLVIIRKIEMGIWVIEGVGNLGIIIGYVRAWEWHRGGL